MKAEMINEFNLLQRSMAGEKYTELLKEQFYQLKDANEGVSTWITERGRMLMKMESTVSKTMRILKRKFLKF
jgi:hypothetical protein